MIGELINNYGEVSALAILVAVMVWYLKYTTKRQAVREDKHDKERAVRDNNRDEERKGEMLFIRNLVTNDMKDLHKDSIKNAELNKESIVLVKGIGDNQNKLCKLIETIDKRINGRSK